MPEQLQPTPGRGPNMLGRVIGLLLPSDESDRPFVSRFPGVEYAGPRYDDPAQLAEVARRLDIPYPTQNP